MDRKQDSIPFVRVLPLLWLSIAFIAGIVAGSVLNTELWVWLLLASIFLAATTALRKRISWLPLFALAAFCVLFLGAARFEAAQSTIGPSHVAYYNDSGKWVEVIGLLEKPPVEKDGYVELLVRAESISSSEVNNQDINGLLLARVDYGNDLDYGDRIKLSGQLVTPPEYGDFSYRDYLARQGVHSMMSFGVIEKLESDRGNPFWAVLHGLRERGLETLYRLYPAREAALLAGILLGDESGLSEKVKTAFNDTGTRHIIAISGFNISIIAGLFLALFGRWLGARRGAWVAGIGIMLYTLLVGADASVVRAAIMGTLALVALRAGRQSFALNSLGVSGAAMALVNPLVLWDIGFQLSFAATLGLVLYSEPLHIWAQRWMDLHLRPQWAKRLSRPVSDYLLLTIAAQVFTLPLLLYYFQRLSVFSLPANILILPAQPALMVFGGLSVLVGMVLQPAGQLIAYFAWALAAYSMRIVEFSASLPWSSQTLDSFPLYLVFVWFAVITAASIPVIRKRMKSIRFQPTIGATLLAALALWTWGNLLAAPDSKLHLTLLDLDGEALLIHTPKGRNILINAGSSANQLMDEVSRILPRQQDLDWVIIAGLRADQINGLSGALERLSPSEIALMSETINDKDTAISNQAGELGIPTTFLNSGDQFDLGNGARLEIVSSSAHGAALILRWDNFEALLPVGLDFDQLEELDFGNGLGPVDLLLLADSGYPPVNPPKWITNVSPSIIWSTSGERPMDQEVMNALEGIPIFQADQNGWLQVTTDGKQLWFEVAHR